MMLLYNTNCWMLILVSLLLLAEYVVCQSYSSSLSSEDHDVSSEYSSSEGQSRPYYNKLSSTLDNHGDREKEVEEEEEEEEWLHLDLGEPCEVLRTEGGAVRVWMHGNVDRAILSNVAVGVAELELEQDGLLLPNYANVPKVAYVTQGCGYMGAVLPSGSGSGITGPRPYVRQVEKGDVVALPKGTIYWWYNGGNEVLRVLCAGDMSSLGSHPSHYNQFFLAGGLQRRFGSFLHGFSHKALATAWGVDEDMIMSLLESQKEVGIIRVRRPLRFPETTISSVASNNIFEWELHYTPTSQPDIFVENGGFMSITTSQKLPALHHVGFSVGRVSLRENAMVAPGFSSNAHQLIYVIRGSGQIQVSNGDGRRVFDEEVSRGSFILIPQFFPSMKVAGNEGLEMVGFVTSHRPSMSFLAGRNSVYHGIPKEVLAAAFNVDRRTLEELGRDEEIIFPPPPYARKEQYQGQRSHSREQHSRRGEHERYYEESRPYSRERSRRV